MLHNYVFPGQEVEAPQGFPHAPVDWTPEDAESVAKEEHLTLEIMHWQTVRALQDFYARHAEDPAGINIRELHDALDEHFHPQGGLKHLYEIFPGGPVAQGCRLAGLDAPPGAVNPSFGSVI